MNETQFIEEVKQFNRATRQGEYYEEANPSKGEAWQKTLMALLSKTHELSCQEKHQEAASCYNLLFDCIDAVYPKAQKLVALGNHEDYWDDLDTLQVNQLECYINSLAKTAEPKEYVESLLPWIVADYPFNANSAYRKTIAAATPEQKSLLEKVIKERGVKISQGGYNEYDCDYD